MKELLIELFAKEQQINEFKKTYDMYYNWNEFQKFNKKLKKLKKQRKQIKNNILKLL
jgi:hypothetical protein